MEEVEKEVVEVEDLVFSVDRQVEGSQKTNRTTTLLSNTPLENEKNLNIKFNTCDEKPKVAESLKTRFSLPRPTITLLLRRLKRAILSISVSVSVSVTVEVQRTAANSTASTLYRMARTRRLVTSLTRLLATKSEVVAQIRKRLLTSGQSGLGNGAGKHDDIEVAIYMGDVQGKFNSRARSSII